MTAIYFECESFDFLKLLIMTLELNSSINIFLQFKKLPNYIWNKS